MLSFKYLICRYIHLAKVYLSIHRLSSDITAQNVETVGNQSPAHQHVTPSEIQITLEQNFRKIPGQSYDNVRYDVRRS